MNKPILGGIVLITIVFKLFLEFVIAKVSDYTRVY